MDPCHAWASLLLALTSPLGPASRRALPGGSPPPPHLAPPLAAPPPSCATCAAPPPGPFPEADCSSKPPMSAQTSLQGPALSSS